MTTGDALNPQRIILASASPRRKELLARLGIRFKVIAPGIDEKPWPREAPTSYVLRNASEKARRVGGRLKKGVLVIAADTIVVRAGRILEKPKDARHARSMLRKLSGQWHEVITGICVWARNGSGVTEKGLGVRTRVRMKKLTRAAIATYVATGEPMDKAGGYAIQGGASQLVHRIDGSYTNVVGLPLDELRALLARVGGGRDP